jgi:hypothetical protein
VRVSIVLPNYNYERYLDERMTSLLAQTFADYEILAVDDGSTDGSRAVIEKYRDPRVRTHWFDANAGSTYQRWNDGAALTSGEYLMFAGADDSCEPMLLQRLVEALDAQPMAGMAYARSWVIDAGGSRTALSPPDERWSRDFLTTADEEVPFLLAQRTIPTASAVLLRRSLFERCGGFDTSFRLAADHMLWARMLQHAAIAYVAEPLNCFRTHDATVRTRTSRDVVLLERYRVIGFLLETFDAPAAAKEAVRERLARHWSESLLRPRGPHAVAMHRRIYAAASRVDPSVRSRMARLLTERLIGVRPRGPRAIAAYARRRSKELAHYLRGRNMLRRYSAHYRRACRAYRRAGGGSAAAFGSVRDTGVLVIAPGVAGQPMALPDDYVALVARVAGGAAAALAASSNCRFVPPVQRRPIPEQTGAVPDVVDGRTIAIQLAEPFAIDGLHELCEPLLDELERKIYRSFVLVDKVYVYRSPISRQMPRASWIWHFDNHPREMLKVMIYLTEVTEGTAPFEYLRAAGSGRAIHGSPLAPSFGDSRVAADAVARLVAGGGESRAVTGPRGTVVVFDDNVIHRGNLAQTGHRDVLVLQVRPATFRATPRIDRRWTGSFLHANVNRDPDDLTPHLKREEVRQ